MTVQDYLDQHYYSAEQKDILRERRTALTHNGESYTGLDIGREDLLLLINQHEAASMPFSPVEYPMSSRKRLIADLRIKCNATL